MYTDYHSALYSADRSAAPLMQAAHAEPLIRCHVRPPMAIRKTCPRYTLRL
jgi:hypothetical protein